LVDLQLQRLQLFVGLRPRSRLRGPELIEITGEEGGDTALLVQQGAIGI
jgi:hypothetical protein